MTLVESNWPSLVESTLQITGFAFFLCIFENSVHLHFVCSILKVSVKQHKRTTGCFNRGT